MPELKSGPKYDLPDEKEVFVDRETEEVKTFKDLPPLEAIKEAAKKFKIELNDKPKRNCKKCYERGYTGFRVDPKDPEIREPVPCQCLFPKKNGREKANEQQIMTLNHATRRLLKRKKINIVQTKPNTEEKKG